MKTHSPSVGVDVTTISRFTQPSEKLVNFILHPEEREEYLVTTNKPQFLATHWALKEALYKACSPYLHQKESSYEYQMNKISILNNFVGMPVLRYAPKIIMKGEISLSVTHEGDMVVAMALFNQ